MIGRLVSGLVPAGFAITAGMLRFEGADLTRQPAGQRRALLGRRIAFIPQEPLSALNPVLSVGRQFGEHLARLGVPARERAAQAARWLDAMHLPEPGAMLRRSGALGRERRAQRRMPRPRRHVGNAAGKNEPPAPFSAVLVTHKLHCLSR